MVIIVFIKVEFFQFVYLTVIIMALVSFFGWIFSVSLGLAINNFNFFQESDSKDLFFVSFIIVSLQSCFNVMYNLSVR